MTTSRSLLRPAARAGHSLRTVLWVLLLATAALAGCSTTRTVQGEVQTHTRLAAATLPLGYRIERLPSQQSTDFDPIVRLAAQALERAGLRPEGAQAPLVVQIGVQASSVPRADPWGPAPWGWDGWAGTRGWGVRGIWRMGEPTPLYRRAVNLLIRDARTQEIVYETSAVHEDVWTADPDLYGVLFDAALAGFPNPPAGRRQVRLPYPPPGATALAPAAAQPAVVLPAAPR
ncbi:MAG: DUF4136 domain-containing protein [Burkholderiaceae bacterium]